MTAKPQRILLIEDNRADAVLLQEMLLGAAPGGFDLSRADRMEKAREELMHNDFDAILLDMTLPDSRGLPTLEHIQDVARGIATIVLTGVEDEELAMAAIRQGAQDYLVKGTVDGHAIAKAIRYAIDRKKTEEALRQSEAAFASAKASVDTVNAMSTGVVLADMTGRIVSANPAFEKVTGYGNSDVAGKDAQAMIRLIVDPIDLPKALDVLAAARSAKPANSVPMTIITKNGSRVPLLADVAHIKDPTGVPSAIVLTINDITAQKEQERRNHLITTLLDLFVKTTSRKEYLDAVIQTIREWIGCDYIGIRMLNESGEMPYESLLGFTEDFIRKENDVSLKDTCTCARVVTQAFESQDVPCVTPGGSFHCGDTSKFVDDLTEDGRQRFRGTCTGEFASVTIVPIRCGDRICGVIHLADDKENRITPELMSFVELIMAPVIGEAVRRFDAESSLRESESKYRTLAEHLPAITYTRALDEANTILFMSPQVESMFGFSPADFKESPELWRNQIHHDDRERVLKSLAEAKGKREAFVVEYRLFDKQGRAIWVEDRGAVVANDNGQPLYIQGVMYDITVQKDADQLLRGLTAHLSLAEERERKRLAGALHDSLSQTLALSKIKLGSLSRMMKTEASSAALQEVRDLFSQAVEQSRTLTFELSPPILYELGLRAAVDWLGEKMSEQYGFTFVLEDGTDTWSDMDESLRILMFQSIRELMINAGKHAGATKLSVNLARRNGTVVAVVSDNGKGFDVKSVRKRAHETQSIGLFSIEERMRHIGGEFLIESTPGTGTRMTLSAPTTSTTTTKGS